MTRTRWMWVPVLFLAAGVAVPAQERPLPDQEAFLAEARTHLETDASLQSSYMYVEERRERKIDKRGRVKEETVKVFENYPGLPGEGRWERLIEEDGRPMSAEYLNEQDRKRREKAEAFAARLAERPAREQARQEREWEKQRQEMRETVDDIFRVFDIQMLGRETIDGHDTIAFSLTPRPDARPRTRDGGQMRHFLVRAWISESDHELVRLEAEAVETLSFGLGLLARLHKGARLSFLRRSGTSAYSDYRKFTVETASQFKAGR